MMEWKKVKLGSLCDIFTGKKDVNQTIADGKYLFFSCAPKAFRSNDYIYDGKAIIVAGNGSFTGRVSFYNGKFDLYQRTYACTPKNGDFNIEYVYWYMKHFFELVYSGGTRGSSIPYIVKGDLADFEIFLPPLEDQRRIAAILSSLDAQIENNNRINRNLEAQAQALFKSWFVDFEPWGGVMPEGWREGKLGDYCRCVLGGTPSRAKEEYWNGDVAWINSGEVNRFRITTPSEWITKLGVEKSATKLLPAKTTVLAITGATLGQVSLLEIDTCANQSVIGILQNERVPYEFIYPLMNEKIKELVLHQTGGAQQHINKDNVESVAVYMPDDKIMSRYKEIVAPMYATIANKEFSNLRLASLRDTLLPKLMKGEIEV